MDRSTGAAIVEQRTDAWKEARRAMFTASGIHKLMGKQGLGQTGETYVHERFVELVSGRSIEIAETFAMRTGTEREPIAARIYAGTVQKPLIETGFTKTPGVLGAGASPDRLAADLSFGAEIKCPQLSSHGWHLRVHKAEDLLEIEPAYFWQIQMCLLTFPASQWWDFVSYCPEYPPKLAMWIVPIPRLPWAQEMLQDRLYTAIFMRNDMARPFVEDGLVPEAFLVGKDYF